ncbi:MAG: EAL domain-containing protein [Pseudomonadota bacterium]
MSEEGSVYTGRLAHIDRKIALLFGGLIFVLLLAVFSAVGLYYQHVVDRGEDELTSALTQVLGDSLNRISFSGKYQARLLVEELAEAQPQIAYILISDPQGMVIAHSDPSFNDTRLSDAAMEQALRTLSGEQRVIQELMHDDIHVKDVAIPYRGGYRDEVLGVIRVGIAKERTLRSLHRGWLYLGGLLLVLLALATVLVYRLSGHFGGPIKRLAWELQGILEHAPLLIYIRDSGGHIHAASRSFLEAFGIGEDELAHHRVDELVAAHLPADVDAALETFAESDVVHDLVRVGHGEAARTYMRTKFPISRDAGGKPLDVCVMAVDITERVQVEEALKQSEAQLSQIVEERHLLLEHAKDFFYKHDKNGVFTYLSPAVTQISGYTPEEWAAHYTTYLSDHPINDQAGQYTRETLATGREYPPYRLEIISRDGRRVMLEVSEQAYYENGQVAGIIGVARDITDRYRAEQLLAREKELAQVTLKSIGDAVITTDRDGCITYLNPIAERLTGWRNEAAQGRHHRDVFVIVDETDGGTIASPVDRVLADNRIFELSTENNHILLCSREGQRYSIEDSAAPIRDNSGDTVGVVLVFHDVSATRELTRRINYQATHDALTELVNRTEFERRLRDALVDIAGTRTTHAVLYLDLDQFKVVNDSAGHMAGDALLQQLAQQFETKIRRHDTLARLGGDEFGVLLEECPLAQAEHVAEQLMEVVRAFRFNWEGKSFSVGVSIGLVSIDGRLQHDVQSVLIAADSACYLAKESGRNRVQVYHPGDAEMARLHGMLDWVSRINQALEEQRFILYYQRIDPVDPAQRDERQHVEVLLRMHDEHGELVQPGHFIPAAERYNLMPTVDRWVISTLFSHYHRLAAGQKLMLAVNLSGASLSDDGLYRFISEQFAAYRVPFEAICFEVTETAAIANINKARHFIDKLRSLGCRFALDDFGSGLSSFAYLKNLKVDFLKIDGSFVRDIDEDEVDLEMVDAINRVGAVLRVRTIAEFVESEAIRTKLQELGVDLVQGYAIHKPEPLSRLLPPAEGGS